MKLKLTPTQLEALKLDVDLRLTELWGEVAEVLGLEAEQLVTYVGELIRSAYARGYVDALSETRRGQLCRDHGYSLPERIAPYTIKDGV